MAETINPTEALSSEQAARLRDRLARHYGIYLDDARRSVLQNAISRRSANVGVGIDTYLRHLEQNLDRSEWQHLAELVLNHETVFFRNRHHFTALRDVVLPELHRRLPPGAPIRIWSAGCASGEEAYSLAITALEVLGDPLPRPVQIRATDLSSAALDRARAGVYRGRTLSNLSPSQRARYFNPRGGELVVNDSVRALVQFEQQNLMDAFPSSLNGTQIVFCQNVTIYFQLDTCRDLMARIYAMMAEQGSLFLGFSETLWNIFDRFRWKEIAGSFVYYKESHHSSTAEERTTLPAKPEHSARAPRRRTPPQPSRFAEEHIVAKGRALIDAGNADEALRLFADTPLIGRHAPQMLALTARIHADRGDLDLALAEARRALELNSLTTEAYVLIGLIFARQNQVSDAIRYLERARYLDPQSATIMYHLAECHRRAGRREIALREYRNTLRALADLPPEQLLDGVAVAWLSETCVRYVAQLER